MTKVFGVGFQKTGTSTLGKMLGQLDYKIAGYWQFRDLAKTPGLTLEMLWERAERLASEFDGAKDTPWPLFYRELDAAFPGSKFIHVVRDPDDWIASACNDFGREQNEIHRAIYGVPCPKGHEQIWLDRYRRHNAEVEAYFQDRPADYLRVTLGPDLSFETLCPFLGKPMVTQAAPVANTRRKKLWKMRWRRLIGRR